jgi:hypothetical protein
VLKIAQRADSRERTVTWLHLAGGGWAVTIHHCAIALAVGAFGACFAWTSLAAGQTITGPNGIQNQPPQNPQAGQLLPPLPFAGVPATVITPETTSSLRSSSTISRPGISLALEGRGLPGMPGVTPLNAAMGAQDPSARYMRPPVIGPLFCDPSINIAC